MLEAVIPIQYISSQGKVEHLTGDPRLSGMSFIQKILHQYLRTQIKKRLGLARTVWCQTVFWVRG